MSNLNQQQFNMPAHEAMATYAASDYRSTRAGKPRSHEQFWSRKLTEAEQHPNQQNHLHGDEELNLLEHVRRNGVHTPIRVWPASHPANTSGVAQIRDGHHRLAAAAHLGQDVPIRIEED